MVTDEYQPDGRIWRHASVSRLDKKMPTYWHLAKLKKLTMGPERIAIQVFPPADRHIDIGTKGPNPVEVLHLWSPEDDFLPDFGRYGTI